MAKKKITTKRKTTRREVKRLAEEKAGELQERISKLRIEDILDEEQLEIYTKASEQQKKWLEYFIRIGDPNVAAEKAYPNQAGNMSRFITSSRLRKMFKISVADLFRAVGIDELKIAKKTTQLLDAKRTIKRFKKGDLVDVVEEEDNFAIGKGLDVAIKLTGNEPTQKIQHGEDSKNPMFRGLAELIQSQQNNKKDD